jgi:toxin ParE1/3/4
MKRGIWKARAAAENDIDEISLYIAEDSPVAAERFIRAVHESFDLLAQFPRLGQKRTAASRKLASLRTWPIGGSFHRYLIIYLEQDYGVEVLRVVHGMRDIERLIGGIR